jgi:2-polyprenyl-6-methoxyphenol hydroxylase-like FAD-dependent oxidoreductase
MKIHLMEELIAMTQNKIPRIAIIGAGPGGLTLARILQTRNIDTTVFERESHPDERPQGGTLDLHPESGQLAVHIAGLDEQFRAIARYEDQGSRLLSKEGQILLDDQQDQETGDRPEVDRTALRVMLLNSLNPGTVRWGHNLRSIRRVGQSIHELVFENGLSETFDLVVGADGAWSRIRPLLSSATPYYTGVTFIEFGLDEVDQKHPALAQLVGAGSMFALANNKGLITQRNGHGHIRVYAGMRVPEGWETTAGFDARHPQKARTWLLDQFSDWDRSLLALIQEANDRFVVRPLYMLPIGHRWDFHPGVTLLGDAAHLMSPFSGEGVNLAMLDAADLACAISESSSFEDAVRSYEETMFARAEIAARGADEGLMQAISPDAPARTLAFFKEVMQQS